MNRKLFPIITVIALALVAVGAIGYQAVYAQETTPEVQAEGSPIFPDREIQGLGPGGSQEELAEALGISVDELDAAVETAKANALAQAVEEGLITQAQADAYQSGERAVRGLGGWQWLSQNGIDYEALLADALGISVDELQAARAEAADLRLQQAVEDGRLTEEQADLIRGRQALFADETFQTSMQSAFEAAVNQAVTDGVITQAQADLILAQAAEREFGGHLGGFFGGGRGHRGGGGW